MSVGGASWHRALLAALAARDGYTEEHSVAVVGLALDVGRRLRLTPAELEDLEHVALLHDAGKLGIADQILRKPGPLSEPEWQVMRTHPVIGEQVVASMPALAHLAPAVRAEHERWDGTGYPDGLAADAIPRLSTIVLVCDAVHAMTSDRPYRSALPLEAARAELRRHSGSQFSPAVVDAALAVLASAADRQARAGAGASCSRIVGPSPAGSTTSASNHSWRPSSTCCAIV